jgi:DNA-directed RNA polymerase specialized sigma24 family protein
MTVPMVAELLGVSVATVERDLALARAWLASQMK